MASTVCSSCQKPNPTLQCGACHEAICKNCVQIVDGDSFSFLDKIPKDLTYVTYCNSCYDTKVAPALEAYNQTMGMAKDINVFFKKEGKETRVFRRNEKPLHVEGCTDRQETILRLAFLAAKAKYNTIIDVDLSSKKVITSGYQTTVWSGTCIPVNADAGWLSRR